MSDDAQRFARQIQHRAREVIGTKWSEPFLVAVGRELERIAEAKPEPDELLDFLMEFSRDLQNARDDIACFSLLLKLERQADQLAGRLVLAE